MSQAIATAKFFQARDLFVHDGSHLRRLRLSTPAQMAMLIAMVVLLTWSAYSAFRLFLAPTPQAAAPAAVSSDIARLAAATEARVQQIEQRQKILAAMIAGEQVDPEAIAKLGYTEAVSPNAARGGPFNSASQSDPTFKSLFTSWKKLDNLADGAIAVPSDKPVKTAEFTSATASAPIPSAAAQPVTRASISPLRSARPFTPPPTALSSKPATTAAAMATSSRSTMAAVLKPATATCRDPGQPGPARYARPADRPHGLDRPFDRQPPPL